MKERPGCYRQPTAGDRVVIAVEDAVRRARRTAALAARRLRGEPDRDFVRRTVGGVLEVWLAADPAALSRLRVEAEKLGVDIAEGVEGADRIRALVVTGHTPESDRMVDALARVLMAIPAPKSPVASPAEAIRGLERRLGRLNGLSSQTHDALVVETERLLGHSNLWGLPGLVFVGPTGSWKERAASQVAAVLSSAGVLQRHYLLELPALRLLESENLARTALDLTAGGGLLVRDLHPLAEGFLPWEHELNGVVAQLRMAHDHPSVLGRRLLVVAARTDSEVSRLLALHPDLPRLFRPPIHFEALGDEALASLALRRWESEDPEAHQAAVEAVGLLRSLPGFAGTHSAEAFHERLMAGLDRSEHMHVSPAHVRAVAAELAPPPDPGAAQRAMSAVDRLVGLGSVAEELREIVAAAEVNARRRRAGLPMAGPPPHLLLLGEPGTGKTTVARLLGPLLHAAGALVRPDVVEVGREDLVGQYIGQTAPRVAAAWDRAKGGVLFVDEAYALDAHSERDFGHEALASLVALMENHRHGTVVVLAGYTAPTLAMVGLNPGLASRIGRTIRFPDLSPTDLVAVFCRLAEDHRIGVDNAALEAVGAVVAGPDFSGGGRGVRNLFERSAERHACRCVQAGIDPLAEPLRLADIGPSGGRQASSGPVGGYL